MLNIFFRRGQRDIWALLLVLAAGFLVRLVLSDKSSYWLDELYSVLQYGINFETPFHAVWHLARTSIHPPVYQFILNCWMLVFGHTEVATRSLSNVYMVGATLFLYLTIANYYSKRAALGAAIVFSFMYTTTYYGIEARSYAQTVFLASMSGWALFRYLDSLNGTESIRELINRPFIVLAIVNLGLLLTHYYNVFFLAAQGAFVLAYILWLGHEPWRQKIIKVAIITGLPLAGLLVLWGPVMIYTYLGNNGRFSTEGLPAIGPLDIFRRYVINPVFNLNNLLLVLGLSLWASFIGVTLWRLASNGRSTQKKMFKHLYFLVVAFLPVVFSYVVFVLSGHERYSARYWNFTAPAIAALVVFGFEIVVRTIAKISLRPIRLYLAFSPIAFLILAAVTVGQDGFSATRVTKADWRGMTRDIVDIMEHDPDTRYVIYETTFRRTPTIDYYLSQFSDDWELAPNLTTTDERSGVQPSRFREDAEALGLESGDRVIIAFTHQQADEFPTTLAAAEQVFDRLYAILAANERGFIVYEVP